MREKFPEASRNVEIVVLDIPDDSQAMDPELVSILDTEMDSRIEQWLVGGGGAALSVYERSLHQMSGFFGLRQQDGGWAASTGE